MVSIYSSFEQTTGFNNNGGFSLPPIPSSSIFIHTFKASSHIAFFLVLGVVHPLIGLSVHALYIG